MVSVSPQSRASLAAHYGLNSSEVARRLTSFLKNLGELEAAIHLTSQTRSPMQAYLHHKIKNKKVKQLFSHNSAFFLLIILKIVRYKVIMRDKIHNYLLWRKKKKESRDQNYENYEMKTQN